ncbi:MULTISPECIES: acyl carrier protein [Roseomonadaceae]|jgi:acyl carrier protein|uniref:Acyl carrier protein n=1 Tax=Falsiroseomonas oleicola TaxID=2801474 RepID=A0ABS6HD61_9PROT|nr:acyl carrier protein [Roseomonas oleicola]MBU8545411.1 acyl carrier protein [Roseomonas oleicola]
MPAFTLADLEAIAREVIGDRDIALTAEMAAADVPGWDSLNHTLISVEIEGRSGAEVDAQQLAECATFGDLVAFVAARQPN